MTEDWKIERQTKPRFIVVPVTPRRWQVAQWRGFERRGTGPVVVYYEIRGDQSFRRESFAVAACAALLGGACAADAIDRGAAVRSSPFAITMRRSTDPPGHPAPDEAA